MNRRTKRFIAFFLVTLSLIISFRPTLVMATDNMVVAQANPSPGNNTPPNPANDNNPVPGAANDNRRMVVRLTRGLILRLPLNLKAAILSGTLTIIQRRFNLQVHK